MIGITSSGISYQLRDIIYVQYAGAAGILLHRKWSLFIAKFVYVDSKIWDLQFDIYNLIFTIWHLQFDISGSFKPSTASVDNVSIMGTSRKQHLIFIFMEE
jgi:hypothetical protein